MRMAIVPFALAGLIFGSDAVEGRIPGRRPADPERTVSHDIWANSIFGGVK